MYACKNVYMHAYMYAYVDACVLSLFFHKNVHIFDMSLNNYDCKIASINHIATMLTGHVDPTFLHMCFRTQTPAICTSQLFPFMSQQQICFSNAKFDMCKLAYVHL